MIRKIVCFFAMVSMLICSAIAKGATVNETTPALRSATAAKKTAAADMQNRAICIFINSTYLTIIVSP